MRIFREYVLKLALTKLPEVFSSSKMHQIPSGDRALPGPLTLVELIALRGLPSYLD